MTLEELQINQGLSNKAFNLCTDSGLHNLDEIVKFHNLHGDFKRLRSCGVKTNAELLALVNRNRTGQLIKKKDSIDIFENIKNNNVKSDLFLELCSGIVEKLSVRAINCILSITKEEIFDIWKFIAVTENPLFSFLDVRNVGVKTVKELVYFKSQIIELNNQLNNREISPEDLLCSELSNLIGHNFNDDAQFRMELESKSIDLIYFLDRYILGSDNVSSRDRHLVIFILESNYDASTKPKAKYKDLSKLIGMSLERCRQLVLKMEINFKNKFEYIRRLFEYSFDLNSSIRTDYWQITLPYVENSKPLIHLSRSISTWSKFLQLLEDESYFVINNTNNFDSHLGPTPYNKSVYLNYRYFKLHYLVNTSFINKENLIDIIEKIYNVLIDKITNQFLYYFDDFNLNGSQINFVTKLISDNFGLVQRGEQVLINKNTLTTAVEVIQIILEENNDLMTAEEIQEEYLIRFPEKNKPLTSIRSVLNNNVFIYFRGNGPSRYGLRDWKEKRGLMPGSIKSICFDFISANDSPVHLYELERYVRKFRDTNMKNIVTNLKLDQKQKFTFYNGNFIGLAEKRYSNKLIRSYKNPNPQDANTVCFFLRNHWYYDYNKLISKYSEDFELKPIQVEHIIHLKCSEGILRVKNEKVYYNMMEEDSLINKLFNDDLISFKISGFNPYKIDLKEKRLLSRVMISTENQISFNTYLFEFNKYDLDKSDFCSIIFYHKSFKTFQVFLWKASDNLDDVPTRQFSFLDQTDYLTEKIINSLVLYKFSLDQSNSFQLIARNALSENDYCDLNYDLDMYNIKGMSKIMAYSDIISTTEKLTGRTIDLSEAAKIYGLLRLKT